MELLYVMKIGGSVLTDKDRYAEAKPAEIERVTGEIAEERRRQGFDLVLINGAGSFGHAPVERHGVEDGIRKKEHVHGVASVHKHVEELNGKLWDFLHARGVSAVPVHPMSFILAEDGEFEMETGVIEEMLDHGMVPLLYGDIVMDTERGAHIVSGDDLAPMLASELDADKVLMGTDTDGVYDRPPGQEGAQRIPEIREDNFDEVFRGLGGSSGTDVTGGMREKVRKLMELDGVECLIYDARIPGKTRKALAGETVGTRIKT